MLVITKIYNNNVVQAVDDQERELIVMGKGLGFQQKIGHLIAEEKIEKTFVLQDNMEVVTDLRQLYGTLSQTEVELVNAIISKAEDVLQTNFELSLYISLGDHLHFAIERSKQNLALQNPLAWEVRKFYPIEYKLGLEVLELIQERVGIVLEESEASSIALHFINAQQNSGIMTEKSYIMTRIVTDILEIVRLHYGLEMDENDIHYHRFVTHIQYFAQRAINGLIQGSNDAFLYDQVERNYPTAFSCTKKIRNYVKEVHHFEMSQDEQVYLTIHLQRLTKK